MTTVSGWMTAKAAEEYHVEDNYYTKSIGIFRGDKRLLAKLGIKEGQVVSKRTGKKIFNKLLQGINPETGKSMFRKLAKGVERRAGFDVTFSPSKSVSLVYEFGSDEIRKAISQAHQKAVKTAMESVQKHIQVRVPDSSKKNKQKLLPTEIVYLEIEHDVSRESETHTIDPDLHTHNFIMNMGLAKSDEKIRSLNNDELYHKKRGENTHLINQIGSEYRLTLANEMEKIGFLMENTDSRQNFYEIAGVERETILAFSQRARDIEIQADEYLEWKIQAVKEEGEQEARSPEEIATAIQKVKDDFGSKDVRATSQKNKIAKKKKVNRKALREENRQRFEDFKGIDSGVWVDKIIALNRQSILEKRVKLLEEIKPELIVLLKRENIVSQDMVNILAKDADLWNHEIKVVSPFRQKVRDLLKKQAIKRAGEVVALAIASIEQESSLFNSKIILERSMTLSARDKIAPEVLKKEIEKAIENGELIPFVLHNRNIVLSTKKIYSAEKEVFSLVEEGKGQFEPLLTVEQKKKIESYRRAHFEYRKMNKGQVAMADFIFSSRDQFFGINGDAGTGKTFSLTLIREAIEKVNPALAKKIVGISFTGKASAGLEADSGIKSFTLDSFLLSEKKSDKKQEGGRIIVIDEATMVGSLKMKELFDIAKKNGDRVILVGDPKQFSSISAGSLFKDLLDNKKIKTFELTEVMRQKNNEIKQIITDMKQHRWGDAIEALEKRGSLHELDDKSAVLKAAGLYINSIKNKAMGDDLVDRSLIIASTNIVRKASNAFIREELKEQGVIAYRGGYEFNTYASVNIMGIEQYMATGVAAAKPDFIIPYPGVKGLASGKEYAFIGVSKDKKSIVIEDADKNRVEVNIEKDGDRLGYFKAEKREFVENEIIVLSKNDKKLGFKNGMRGKILEVREDKIVVNIDGKAHEINPAEYPYIDYGYAVTDFKSQGSTTGHVIALAHPKMASQNSFYTQVTRCKHNATIITSNIEKFTQNAHKTGVSETTTGKKRLPDTVAIKNLWGNKISEEENLILKKEDKIKIQKIIAHVATVADTIPNFISRAKEQGVYVDLREYIAICDGECIKLDKDEVEKMKKQFRINYVKNKKNEGKQLLIQSDKKSKASISDERKNVAINVNKKEDDVAKKSEKSESFEVIKLNKDETLIIESILVENDELGKENDLDNNFKTKR